MLKGREVKDPPRAILMYELCKTFHKLPSEIDQEDYKDIQELLIVHNTVNEYEKSESRKSKRNEAKNKLGGGVSR